MSKSLADILGWEEGAVYRYNNRFLKIKHGLLLSSLTREEGDWCVDWTVKVNDVFYLKEAIKVEPKKYYLKHKFLGIERYAYLNYGHIGKDFELNSKSFVDNIQTQFTDDEIEEIEATGFDLCNFEKVEV